MKKFYLSNKLWMVLGIVALVGAMFYFYFMVLVKNREAEYVETKFRQLRRTAQNVRIAKDNMKKRTLLTASSFLESICVTVGQLSKSEMDLWEKVGRLNTKIATAVETLNADCRRDGFDMNVFSESQYLIRKKQQVDSVYVSLPLNEAYKYTDFSDLKIPLSDIVATDCCPKYFVISTSMRSFLGRQGLDLRQNFDEFLVVKVIKNDSEASAALKAIKNDSATAAAVKVVKNDGASTVVVKVINNDSAPTEAGKAESSSVSWQTLRNEVKLSTLDSILKTSGGFISGGMKKVVLSDHNYYAFAHRLTFGISEDWVLVGLVHETTFGKETREINLITALTAALGILFLLLSMPILKLILMSAYERLHILNVWSVGSSIIAGTFLAILMLNLWHHIMSGKLEVDNNIATLNHSIRTRLAGELNEVYLQLKDFDNGKREIFNQSNVSKTPAKTTFSGLRRVDQNTWMRADFSFDKKTIRYPLFNQAIWINKDGEQGVQISTSTASEQRLIRLSDRAYFQSALKPEKDSLWLLPGTTAKENKRISLQSIRSWRTGRVEAGIAIPTSDTAYTYSKFIHPSVIAMPTRLHSITDPLLPPGYKFSIVDGNGDVLFHSESEKNLQENLFEEHSGDKLLRAAVLGRDSVFLTGKYCGNEVRMLCAPIHNLPYSIVVFYDLDYYQAPIDLTVGQAVLYGLVYFLVIGFHFLILLACSYRATRLKINRFFLSWLRPRIDSDSDPIDSIPFVKPSLKYRRSIFFLGMLLAFMGISAFLFHDLTVATSFILLPSYVLIFHYLVYRRETIILDNSAKEQSTWWSFLTEPFVVATFLYLVAINGFVWKMVPQGHSWTLGSQVVWLVIGAFCYPRVNNNYKTSTSWLWRYPSCYRWSLFLWLLVLVIVPTLFFYKSAYYTQTHIWNKYLLLEAARAKADRLIQFDNNPALQAKPIKAQRSRIDSMGDYLFTTRQLAPWQMAGYDSTTKPNYRLEEILFKVPPSFRSLIDKTKQAVFTLQDDSQKWYWRTHSDDNLSLHYTSDAEEKIDLQTAMPPWDLFKGEYWMLVVIAFGVTCVILFIVIKFAVKGIFAVDFLDQGILSITTKDIAENSDCTRLFVTGLPFSGKKRWATAQWPNAKLITFSDKRLLPTDKNEVIISHFEFGVNDHAYNKRKFFFVNMLLQRPKAKIIILSSIQPSAIIEYYETMFKDEKDPAMFREYKHAIRYWKNALAGFTLCYQPLNLQSNTGSSSSAPVTLAIPGQPDATPSVSGKPVFTPSPTLEAASEAKTYRKAFLDSEVGHGTYLNGLRRCLGGEDGNLSPDQKEEIVLHVEELAENYYASLWNSFTRQEKFLLYDLAKDRFVNFKNLKIIRALIQKGVLSMGDSLRIMNRSFSNYILSAVGGDEEMEMRKDQLAKGTWNTVQLGLIICLIGAASFVAFTRQGLLGNLNAWITAITGLVALTARFGGIFGGNKTT